MVADCFHVGHINIIKKASQIDKFIIILLFSDQLVINAKKIVPRDNYLKRLNNCLTASHNVKGVIRIDSINEIKKIIRNDLICHGHDILDPNCYLYDVWKTYPNKVIFMRTEGVSSTKLRTIDKDILDFNPRN